jgi:hypothetical protein
MVILDQVIYYMILKKVRLLYKKHCMDSEITIGMLLRVGWLSLFELSLKKGWVRKLPDERIWNQGISPANSLLMTS